LGNEKGFKGEEKPGEKPKNPQGDSAGVLQPTRGMNIPFGRELAEKRPHCATGAPQPKSGPLKTCYKKIQTVQRFERDLQGGVLQKTG